VREKIAAPRHGGCWCVRFKVSQPFISFFSSENSKIKNRRRLTEAVVLFLLLPMCVRCMCEIILILANHKKAY
jgi:hypothetical protein